MRLSSTFVYVVLVALTANIIGDGVRGMLLLLPQQQDRQAMQSWLASILPASEVGKLDNLMEDARRTLQWVQGDAEVEGLRGMERRKSPHWLYLGELQDIRQCREEDRAEAIAAGEAVLSAMRLWLHHVYGTGRVQCVLLGLGGAPSGERGEGTCGEEDDAVAAMGEEAWQSQLERLPRELERLVRVRTRPFVLFGWSSVLAASIATALDGRYHQP